jgi:hypothetical protein
VSTCSVSCSPTNRTAPWRWTSAPVGPAARWRAAGAPAKRRPGLPSNPRASQARSTQHHPFPSDLMRAGDQAASGPRRHVEPAAPSGSARSTEPYQGPARHRQRGCRAADTGGLSVRTPRWNRSRGHRTRGHRTRGHRTRGHQTSARPIGRTSARRTEDADRATTGVAGVRTCWRPATTRWAANLAGAAASGPLGHPLRLRGDNICAAALTAAATEQLRSTAQHEAAPRRTAVVCWIWMVRVEGNGTTER